MRVFFSLFSFLSSGRCLSFFFFFFQAEDGIRDVAVTGVQTCALPIYHVLHVVRVSRAVHVCIVPLLGRVLHVRRGDRQDLGRVAPPLGRARLRHLVVGDVLRQPLLLGHLRHRRRQRRLPVVHVPNRAHVHVRLGALEFRFGHGILLDCQSYGENRTVD